MGANNYWVLRVRLDLRKWARRRLSATGFSPHKANLSPYIMSGYQDFAYVLDRLGKHNLDKACLYINKFADVDVVAEIVKTGVDDLTARWPMKPS